MKTWNVKRIRILLALLAFLALTSPLAGQTLSPPPFSFGLEYGLLDYDDVAALGLDTYSGRLPVAVVWLRPAEGYHSYAHSPGSEEAFPTALALQDVDSTRYQVRYMRGERQPDVFDSSTPVWVYTDATPVFVIFLDGVLPADLAIHASLLACSDAHCVPLRQTLSFDAPPDPLPFAAARPWHAALKESLPGNPAPPMSSMTRASHAPLPAAGRNAPLGLPRTSVFGGDAEAMPVQPGPTPDMPEFWDFSPQYFQASLEVKSMGKALIFGLLAGLLLNVMPCVLPVLTLKVSSLLTGEGNDEQRRHAFREHNLLFAAGILTWFAALALLFGLAGMAWGQLFQNSGLVFALLLLIFCLGLSMFGVFHLPVLDLRVGAPVNPRVQAYSSGLLATLLATPCSGPLLGGVLSWSLTQSALSVFTVFLATGVGMASPYLLAAWRPALARRLPRPGVWMRAVERLLAFFLMGSALYLLSILPSAMHIPALATLLVTALAAWIWGEWGGLRASGLRKTAIGGACLLAVALSAALLFAPAKGDALWLEYERGDFMARLGRENILLEFTADWCPTCKVLERSVLSSAHLSPLAEAYNLTLIRVDMTAFNPELQALQRALNSASIPLLALFPKGESQRRPIVLRDLYGEEELRGVLSQTLSGI